MHRQGAREKRTPAERGEAWGWTYKENSGREAGLGEPRFRRCGVQAS